MYGKLETLHLGPVAKALGRRFEVITETPSVENQLFYQFDVHTGFL
jgi:hypothetical protein